MWMLGGVTELAAWGLGLVTGLHSLRLGRVHGCITCTWRVCTSCETEEGLVGEEAVTSESWRRCSRALSRASELEGADS